MRSTKGTDEFRHGRAGYINYGCRCPVCSDANTNYCKEWREGVARSLATGELVMPPCSTENTANYTAYKCRCAICREAIRICRVKARARMRPEDISHGTVTGYTNHGCRCPECRAAQSKYMRDWRTKKNRKG